MPAHCRAVSPAGMWAPTLQHPSCPHHGCTLWDSLLHVGVGVYF